MVVYNDELYHYGVKGMRWGHRKTLSKSHRSASTNKLSRSDREKQYRKKLSNIEKRHGREFGNRDIKYIHARNKTLGKRISYATSGAIAGEVIQILLTGGFGRYKQMSKSEIKKDIFRRTRRIASETAFTIGTQNILAKSAASKYDNEGHKHYKDHIFYNRENLIKMGLYTSKKVIPAALKVATYAATRKYVDTVRSRQENERRFNSWGGNILSEQVDRVIYTSPDSSEYVYEKNKR